MKYLFWRDLAQEDGLAFRILDKHRHHQSGEIEGNFVEFPVLLNQGLLVEIGAIQYCGIKQVLQSLLKMADEVAIPKHFIRLSAGDITVPLQGDTIFGEGTGLIGAEYVHSTKVLNGVETFHDYLFAAHGKRALGQADGHNHGQHLRGQANGYGHREEECSFPVVLGKPVDEEDHRQQASDERNHDPCEAAQALIKACWRAFPGDPTRHRAEISTNSRNDNDRGRCAALNACAHEACVVELDRSEEHTSELQSLRHLVCR